MGWLNYFNDEVKFFHPAFREIADQALVKSGLDGQLEWVHHQRTPGNKLIPDFVLREKASNRWRLAVEVKRTKQSVFSTPNQAQAKYYAEHNGDLYDPTFPKYFCITNLESSVLFALRSSHPPNECRLLDGIYEIGSSLPNLTEQQTKELFREKILEICRRVTLDRKVKFDLVWPSILSNFVSHARAIVHAPQLQEPETPQWEVVRDYFCQPIAVDGARSLLLNCLMLEYIRGIMQRFEHRGSNRLIPLRDRKPNQIGPDIVNALTRMREIDFSSLFDQSVIDSYRDLEVAETRNSLKEYVRLIVGEFAIADLARDRLDRNDLIDGLITACHGEMSLEEKGKVTTDPEVASLLVNIVIDEPGVNVMDPCCGHGSLLEASYERLRSLGMGHDEVLGHQHGIEADPLLVQMAILRLLLKEPASINQDSRLDVSRGDMFASLDEIGNADVILMNPPFRRYEAQAANPVPPKLREYYSEAIRKLTGHRSVADSGQQNLYTYYVELVVHAAREGCRFGIVLDNKWYHNSYARPLKQLLLQSCAIEAIIDYPYANLFSDFMISTSILVCRKQSRVSVTHKVAFLRCSLDLTQVDQIEVGERFRGRRHMVGWTLKEEKQKDLDPKNGWKNYFVQNLVRDYRSNLPLLLELFDFMRRGSLAKEEGGLGPLAFPFSTISFGNVRRASEKNARKGQIVKGRALNSEENSRLMELAAMIPAEFRGYAVNNSDQLKSYLLSHDNLLDQATLEPPSLRNPDVLDMFWSRRKTQWTDYHNQASEELRSCESVKEFIDSFRKVTGLRDKLMPTSRLLIGLREPYAGELIIPRKLRSGHRVHINPFACSREGRQVRLSSNFWSFNRCVAVNEDEGLDCLAAVQIIAAFLISSFGQLQFEMEGYNREGLLSIEGHHLKKIRVIDPRSLKRADRTRIINRLTKLDYPVPMNTLSDQLAPRNALDEEFARILCKSNRNWTKSDLLAEVHGLLDEYLLTRSP